MFVLVTGGSGSGKSEYAEQRVLEFGDTIRYYLATMMCFDDEGKNRVERHRKMRRGKGFQTVERHLNLSGLELPETSEKTTVLLECMSNLTANEMFDQTGSREQTVEEVKTGIDRLRRKCDNLVVVTNEVFSDGIIYDEETRRFQSNLGKINAYLAKHADEVVEIVCGLHVFVKGGLVK